MKWTLALIVLLAAAPAPGQNVVLGVLEAGDFTITIDTTTFFWGTLPDAQFVPTDWSGGPGATDTFEFELMQSVFPAHVWIDYNRGGTAMARETIIGLAPDYWYELPRFDKAPTRVKFLPPPGIEEGSMPGAGRITLRAGPNPFLTSTTFSLPPSARPTALTVYDAGGSLVRTLSGLKELVWDGRNTAGREVATGIYLCRLRTDGFVAALRLVKLD
jgi:hypothetical protein